MSACIDIFVKRHGEEVQEMYKHLERLIQVDNLCVAVQVCVHACVCVCVCMLPVVILYCCSMSVTLWWLLWPCLQQDQWQAEMDHLLERLLQSSAVAVDKLAEAVSRQTQLNQQQRNAEKNQERILHTGHKVCWWTRVVVATT